MSFTVLYKGKEMKKRSFLVFAMIVMFAGSLQHCSACEENQAERTPFFVDQHISGLSLNEKGEVVYGDWKMSISLPSEDKIRAAALHKDEDILTVVTDNATVICYSISDKKTAEIGRFTPSYEAQTITVRFSHIAGLVYLLFDDVKHRKELEKDIPRQEYSDRYHRLSLIKTAEKWCALPAKKPNELMLGMAYYLKGKKVILRDSEGKRTTIKLNETLGTPYRSGPGDPLAQAVFLFAGQGIVCRTVQGWSLHRPDGKLIRYFSTSHIHALWWGEPFASGGKFFVRSRTGPGGSTYLLDTKTGKLTEQMIEPDKE
jgi:hypothetical protein